MTTRRGFSFSRVFSDAPNKAKLYHKLTLFPWLRISAAVRVVFFFIDILFSRLPQTSFYLFENLASL